VTPGKLVSVEQGAVYAKLTPIFRELFDDDQLEVKPSLSAKDIADWDSLRNIRMMLTVEKSFGVKLSAAEIGRLQNVGDLVELLQRKSGTESRA
jgi:acyl carrier protein